MAETNNIEKKIDTLTELVVNQSKEIENLAAMTAKGFAELTSYVDGRFDAVDARFGVVEEKLGTLEADVEDTNKRITEFVTPEIERHGVRIKKLEQVLLNN